ncbi:MAG: amidohydrolase [Firmicutes bacterium]|nr:amidohydrolase [Bacillota bacterium]
MNRIYYNGVIKTLDEAYPEVSAIWVKDGVIVRVGDDETILALAEADTETIDLEGKFVLPGCVDSHMHLYMGGAFARRINLDPVKSYAEVVALIEAALPKAREEGGWVVCGRFNNEYWSDTNKVPDRHDLDAIAADVPIFMQRACGHMSTCNTKALQLGGLWEERKDTTKQTMDFGEDGLPNGYLRERTTSVLSKTFMSFEVEDMKKLIMESCETALSKGLVGVHSHDFNIVAQRGDGDQGMVLQAYKELVEEGKLPIRVYQQCTFRTHEQIDDFLSWGYKQNDNIGRFRFGPVKFVADGSLGSHSAAMRKPYKNDPEMTGILNLSDELLLGLAEKAAAAGFDMVAHCIGDRSLEQVMNVFEYTTRKYPRANTRNGIIHCQVMDSKQQDQFKEMNMVAYVQPIFVKSDGLVVDDCVGEELGRQSYNWRRYIDMGVHQCGGSDFPVEPMDPLPNLYYAVSRMTQKGYPWYPENGVTLDEAVRMFTVECAYASHEEATRGTLGVGKYCDMVVLDRNIYERPIEELLETQVLMTIVDGEVAYQK